LIHGAQRHEAIRQQAYRPALVPLRRLAAAQRKEMGLVLPVDLARIWSLGSWATMERVVEPVLHKTLANPPDRGQTYLARLGHALS
jgi:hypothetical protein